MITAVILAGGLGTRIRAAIGDKAKALAAVDGVTFLELFLGLLRQAGIGRAVLLTGFDAEAVETEAQRLSSDDFQVDWVREDAPLGTGGALVNALSALPDQGPFLVMNGDTWIDIDPAALIRAHLDQGADATIAATVIDDCSDFGTLDVDGQDRLLAFREKTPGQGLVNAGVYVMTRDMVAGFPQTFPLSLERDVFPALVQSGRRLVVARVPGPFHDIGTPDRLAFFRDLARDGRLGASR